MLRLATLITALGLALPALAATPNIDEILISGQLADGVTTIEAHLKQQPSDDVARMGLGAIQFVQCLERLTQKLTDYGIQTRGIAELEQILPAGAPPRELLTYPQLRKIIQQWVDDLKTVETTLAKIKDEQVKLTLHVGKIPFNLATNGARRLTLLPVLRNLQLGPQGKAEEFVIAFDRADVDWLRGYCHLMQGVGEIMLAYDGQGLFDVFAHRVFKFVKTPHSFLQETPRQENRGWFDMEEILDVIAAIHMIRLPAIEPQRMKVALEHFEQTLSLSRQMWKRVLAETDDDHEWIPSPSQAGAINVKVRPEMVDHWIMTLDELEQILQGKKLAPFWRGKPTRGVNLRRVFLEPTPLDLVLWMQGTAAIPYLEEGEITRPETWQQINNAFNGQFLGFSTWFN